MAVASEAGRRPRNNRRDPRRTEVRAAGRDAGRRRRRPLAAGLLALLLAPAAGAQAPAEPELEQLDPRHFPVPEVLRPNVDFWIDAFTRYTSHHVLIHDEARPQRIYAVLDFTRLDEAEVSALVKERRRREEVRESTERYRGLLLKLASGERLDDPEDARRLEILFDGAPGGRGEVRLAAERIRSQTGLADRFEEAVVRSGRYLPRMERTFTERGLPRELTRLPFVESMFQAHARSKVAAGGMWQIMPASGRGYLTMGLDVDERFDPFLAAEAAATILEENYQALGNWPLAVTAYNHGKYGMLRAVKNLGSRDLGVIVSRHQSRTFGFASKNFYAEFVAAAVIYENRRHFFPDAVPAPPLTFDEFAPDRYVPVEELARRASVDVDVLKELNPAVAGEVWSGHLLLPAGYRLRVPAGAGETFSAAYAALPDDRKIGRQAGFRYRVRPGDTLSGIATRFGTSVSALAQVNNLRRRDYLRVGQTLYVPPGPGARGATVTTADGTVHVVRQGETLWAIARRYGVSVETLKQANNLSSSHRIYPGQRLTITR